MSNFDLDEYLDNNDEFNETFGTPLNPTPRLTQPKPIGPPNVAVPLGKTSAPRKMAPPQPTGPVSEAEVWAAANAKFGLAIAINDNILLAKRDVTAHPNKECSYMTVQVVNNDYGVSFHHGHYDMSLMSATRNFYARRGIRLEMDDE